MMTIIFVAKTLVTSFAFDKFSFVSFSRDVFQVLTRNEKKEHEPPIIRSSYQ